jgi:hypothetical protein
MVPVGPIRVANAIVETGEATVPSAMEPAGVKTATVKAAGVKAASVKAASVKAASVKAASVKAATAVKPSTPAARGVGEIWLAERSNAQQSSGCALQSPSSPRLGSIHAEISHRRLLLQQPRIGVGDGRRGFAHRCPVMCC